MNTSKSTSIEISLVFQKLNVVTIPDTNHSSRLISMLSVTVLGGSVCEGPRVRARVPILGVPTGSKHQSLQRARDLTALRLENERVVDHSTKTGLNFKCNGGASLDGPCCTNAGPQAKRQSSIYHFNQRSRTVNLSDFWFTLSSCSLRRARPLYGEEVLILARFSTCGAYLLVQGSL